MTGITRRRVMTGAGAATVAAVMPAAALAEGGDVALLALCDRLDSALAAWTEARRRHSKAWYEADRTMPLEQPWLVGRTPAEHAHKRAIYDQHMEAHGIRTLGRECAKLEGECGDLSAAVLRTRAKTPAGIIRKLALLPYGVQDSALEPFWAVECGEPDPVAFVVGSIRHDLERLAGEARS